MFVNRMNELEEKFPGISQVYLIVCVAEMNMAACKMQSFKKRLGLDEEKIKIYLNKLIKDRHIFYYLKSFVSENFYEGRSILRMHNIMDKFSFKDKEISELFYLFRSREDDFEFPILENLMKQYNNLTFNQVKAIILAAKTHNGFKNLHNEVIKNILKLQDKDSTQQDVIKSKNLQFCNMLLNTIKSKNSYKKSNGKYMRDCIKELYEELAQEYRIEIKFEIIEKFLNNKGVYLDG